MKKNLYDILEVAQAASQETIQAAYRSLMSRYHPDKVAGLGVEFQNLANDLTKEINRAYDVLKDPARRAKYDKQLRDGKPSPPPEEDPDERKARAARTRRVGVWVLSLFVVLAAVGLLRQKSPSADRQQVAPAEALPAATQQPPPASAQQPAPAEALPAATRQSLPASAQQPAPAEAPPAATQPPLSASAQQPAPAVPLQAQLSPQGSRVAVPPHGREFQDCRQCPVMVVVPPGSFQMGSDPNDEAGDKDEYPQHRVTIAKAFAIGKYDVTQKEYVQIVGDNPSHFKDSDLSRPVESVSWDEAQEFVKYLSVRTGHTYRLPSEAEWEYAARAGTETRWSFGDDESDLPEHAWFDKNSGNQTHPVGQKKPNPFGLYDMHGNVWQWVADCYHENYQGAPTDGSAWTTNNCTSRVLRGGSWGSEPNGARSAYRGRNAPDYRNFSLGFRIARTITP